MPANLYQYRNYDTWLLSVARLMQSIAGPLPIFQLCIMCTSKCSGSCMSMLKEKLINSKESLKELNDLLNNITTCGAPAGTNKNLFMTEVINLKAEARKLLDEVNHHGERASNGKLISASSYGFQNMFEDNSFRERLNNLKQRIRVLSAQTLVVK